MCSAYPPPSASALRPNLIPRTLPTRYIGESARVIREMFGYARDHEPCIIFMDEVDAIGGRRFSEGSVFMFHVTHPLLPPLPTL